MKMAAWPEITNVRAENRHELILSGSSVSKRLEHYGLSEDLFSCVSLNFLQISETNLSEIPKKIKMLHNLTSLVLYSNNLTELCPEIGELTKLKFLNVSNNHIKEIPEAIGKLQALTSLNMSSNKIEKIPDMSDNIGLSSVDFSHNMITDMSNLCHSQLTHLAEIHLRGNKVKIIPPNINELSALKLLDLSNNDLSQIPGEIGDISKLKDVNLQGNPLADRRLGKLIIQGKAKPILDYIREHCPKVCNEAPGKGKKGKAKGRVKQNSSDGENLDSVIMPPKYKIVILSKSDNSCCVKRTKFVSEVRPYILACIVKNVSWDLDTVKKFIQLQTKMHDGVCDKRNFATIATHDLALCKGNSFTYTALSPDGLKIKPLSRNKEFTGTELFLQLQNEAETLRKEKKRNTYFGIHKFLHLLEGKPLYPCLLNSENTVISFPPLTNSDITKISVDTKEILIEVTSSASQGNCKKVLDMLLKEMLKSDIGTSKVDETSCLTVEQVKIEHPDGNFVAIYPSRADLVFVDNTIEVVR